MSDVVFDVVAAVDMLLLVLLLVLQLQPSMGRATCNDKRQRQTALGMTIEMQLTGQAQLRRQLPSHQDQVNKVTQVLIEGEWGSSAFIIVFKCFEVCFVSFSFSIWSPEPPKKAWATLAALWRRATRLTCC